MFFRVFILILFVSAWFTVCAEESPKSALPEEGRKAIDRIMKNAIANKAFPGGQLIIGDASGVIYSQCYGFSDYSKREKIDTGFIYDMASCTKVLSTTIAVMRLIDDGTLTLESTVGENVSRFKDTPISELKLKELLCHVTGLKPVIPVARSLVKADSGELLVSAVPKPTHPYHFDTKMYVNKNINYDTTYLSFELREGYNRICDKLYLNANYSQRMDMMIINSYSVERRGRYRYSDLNFYLLQQIVECASGKTIDKYMTETYRRMGLANIGYCPLKWKEVDKVAPTECDMLFRRDTIRGYVHDEMAAVQGGVAGNAGLFANSHSVAALCTMLLNGGEYNGDRIISKAIVDKFTGPALSGSVYRGLGFDKQNPATTVYSSESYGHTGYTGTYMWIDPTSQRYLIILTNRVHPSRVNKKYTKEMRAEMWESSYLVKK